MRFEKIMKETTGIEQVTGTDDPNMVDWTFKKKKKDKIVRRKLQGAIKVNESWESDGNLEKFISTINTALRPNSKLKIKVEMDKNNNVKYRIDNE